MDMIAPSIRRRMILDITDAAEGPRRFDLGPGCVIIADDAVK
jgi:hypothetical protein